MVNPALITDAARLRARVLVVEDEMDLLASIADYLLLQGHQVDTASDGQGGLNLALATTYDVVVLDIGLPRLDGLSVCEQIRRSPHAGTGILMLTARDRLQDKLDGLALGADDYLVKPFALEELDMRIRALERRSALNRGQVIRHGEVMLDLALGTAQRQGRPLLLSRAGLALLAQLMRHAPRPVSREELICAVWGDEPPETDALKVHMHHLRRTLDVPFDRPLLETLRGQGYRLVD